MEHSYYYAHWLYRRFKKTTDELVQIEQRMKKRHPMESWSFRKDGPTGMLICFRVEFVDWLECVYFNKEGNYLDKEITFFLKHIKRLEEELNIHNDLTYKDRPLRLLPRYFNKKRQTIDQAVCRMRLINGRELEFRNSDGILIIKKEGIKWLTEHCFKKLYIERLEKYKLSLQDKKEELD